MKLNMLLLCNKPEIDGAAGTIVDHIDALAAYSTHRVWLYSNLGDLSPKLKLNHFDVIILHYSLCLYSDNYVSRSAKKKLRDFKGLKVVFIQDEYRQINKTITELAYLKIDVLFTCFPNKEISRVYSEDKLPDVSKYNNLTGYIPTRFTQLFNQPPIKNRSLDVGYRGRKSPFWLGELAYEKWNIVDQWHEHTKYSGLKVDISYHENDRLYGKKWIDFLLSCKTTLGVESGASVMDFTGALEQAVEDHQRTNPHDSFYDVQRKFFLEQDGKYSLNQISPRCFEAIAHKTVLVLYEGEYSGVLKPWRHFIPLKKDFSNLQQVVSYIRNDEFLQSMADTAFEEIALNEDYSYKTFVKQASAIISKEFNARKKRQVTIPYTQEEFIIHINCESFKNRVYKHILPVFQSLPPVFRFPIKCIYKLIAGLKSFMLLPWRMIFTSRK